MEEPLQSLLDAWDKTIAARDAYMAAQLERNHITLLRGRARFIAPDALVNRADRRLATHPRASIVIIATGSRPRHRRTSRWTTSTCSTAIHPLACLSTAQPAGAGGRL
jgi:pyruvate/2-oxoglutarate dehydrogenase complex dihydrolipoamide dehydrogenase (E3) component